MQKIKDNLSKTWTIAGIIEWTSSYFKKKNIESPRLSAELLTCKALKCSRVALYTDFQKPLLKEELAKIRDYIKRRAGYEPVSYITGTRSFFEFDLSVNKNVLILTPKDWLRWFLKNIKTDAKKTLEF